MDVKRTLKLHKELNEKALKIRKKKSHDYANTKDALANFKVRSAIHSVFKEYGLEIPMDTPKGIALDAVLLKIARLLNLWASNKEPMNESEEDTFIDLLNYVHILYQCRIEELESD